MVYTRDSSGQTRIYQDGVEVASAIIGGDTTGWRLSYKLMLGNETTLDRPWLGEFHLVALYDRALTPDEVRRNTNAGANPR